MRIQAPPSYRSRRGSALILVVFLVFVMALLTGSLLTYTISEKRANERSRLILRARNMAENISTYAAEQVTTKLYRTRSATPMAFMTGANAIFLPPDDVLNSEFTSKDVGMEVRAGLTTSSGLTYINPASDPGNPNAGLQVNTSTVPIITKATATHPAIGSVSSYTVHDLEVDMIPLFQFAIFYNMDLEFGPGANMVISGPVHTNGNLIARGQTGFANTVQFTDRVSAAGGFFANTAHKGPTYMDTGAVDNGPGGTGPLYFQRPSGTAVNIHNGSIWRDHKYGVSGNPTATTLNNFKTFATSNYGVNFRTSVHGVTRLVLPAISDYDEADDPATSGVDERDNGRQIIEPPHPSDSAGLKETKFSRRAGLYIIVNPDDEPRTGRKPDGTSITLLGRSYRCWLNTVSSGTHTLREVILPGQPSYGFDDQGDSDPTNDTMYQNNLPNMYREDSSVGSNQVLRIPSSGRACDVSLTTGVTGYAGAGAAAAPTYPTLTDAYFYDMRRATGNRGYPFARGATDAYTPRPVAKIDFDLTRFRMMVERTVNAAVESVVYYPSKPTNATQWGDSIFNPGAAADEHGLGMGASYSTFPTDTTKTAPDPFKLYYAPGDPEHAATIAAIAADPRVFAVPATALSDVSSPCPWYDGVTVYVHSVDAEVRAQASGVPQRVDSGVRLWNGRGNLVSLNVAGRTGFSFGTNDALYVVGHFNADGVINSTATSTGVGGYSGRYPDNATEKLCSVFGDATTILSQPVFSSSSPYNQISGWSDSLSANRRDDSFSWSSSWRTTNPSTSNRQDGGSTSITPGAMPNTLAAGTGAARTSRFSPTVTEISTCFLIGIVPTGHNPSGLTDGAPSTGANNQTSGGVHNYPRLLENWNGAGLYIRGSMVAMFESRVAMEPWSIRVYTGAGRYWGLHESLRDEDHDLPLEPMLLNARRMRFREITAAEYATKKAEIEALPH